MPRHGRSRGTIYRYGAQGGSGRMETSAEAGEPGRPRRGPLFHRVLPVGFGVPEQCLDQPAKEELAAAVGESSRALLVRGDSPAALVGEEGPDPGGPDRGLVRSRDERSEYLQEVVVSRLGYLNRRFADFSSEHNRRAAEDKKETRILLGGLSVVLVFCFAAFYLNQLDVKDLRAGLEGEIEKRSEETVASLDRSLDEIRSEHLPRLRERLERTISERRRQDGERLAALEQEVRRLGDRNGVQVSEALGVLEDHLERLERISHDIHQLQVQFLAEKPDPRAASSTTASRPSAASTKDVAVKESAREALSP